MITYISILLGFLCLGILIYSTFLKSTNFRLISKIFCSLCFLLISITAYLNNPVNLTYFYLIFIGLLFSFLGDIFLGIKKSEPKFNYILFMLGIISFSVTHIFYSICFINLSTFHIRDIIFAIFLTFIIIASLKYNKKIDFRNLIIPCTVYGFLISFMVCKSISLISLTSTNTLALSLIIVGAILFIIPDYLLSFVMFYKNCPKSISRLNLLCYYVGQFLIALSILYI